MTRFQFVADHRNAFEVKRLCYTVGVSRSSFYAWADAAESRAARAAADQELADRIRAVHAEHRSNRAYGAPRVTAELNSGVPADERVNHKRVARVMAKAKIAGIRLRRRVRTTIPELADQPVPDRLKRNFTAAAPNSVYVGDITYLLCTDGSTFYLATVIDCFSRRLVGWSIAEHMRTELVTDALTAAVATRGSLAGAIFHSDHGAQGSTRLGPTPTSGSGSECAARWGAVGTSADNALAESFNATLKREVLAGAPGWNTPAHARREVFTWITHYNTGRRHSACAQTRPNAYEARRNPTTLPIAA